MYIEEGKRKGGGSIYVHLPERGVSEGGGQGGEKGGGCICVRLPGEGGVIVY